MVDSPPDQKAQQAPTLVGLFWTFLQLGATAFGGPAMIPYIRKAATEKNNWLKADAFKHGLALCQTIPGATAMQMAAYVGLKARGVPGAICTYVGFGLPAFLLMLALSAAYSRSHGLPTVLAVFSGLQAIIVAVTANATISFGRTTLRSASTILIALVATGLFLLKLNPVFIILVAGLLGILFNHRGVVEGSKPEPEEPTSTVLPLSLMLLVSTVWFLALFLLRKDLFHLALLIARIDLVSFGGGFASIPLMFHEIVDVRAWLDAQTYLNGIALGQFTPGPFVITATFVGFMTKGLLGAVVATIAVFLPSFVLLVGVAPWFDRVRHSPWVSHAVGGILCSFVGLLFTVTLRFAGEVHWDWRHGALAVAALTALLNDVDLPWVVLPGTAISAFMF